MEHNSTISYCTHLEASVECVESVYQYSLCLSPLSSVIAWWQPQASDTSTSSNTGRQYKVRIELGISQLCGIQVCNVLSIL